MSMIKRFKEILEGDLGLFEKAVLLSPTDFEMNEAKTHLRPIPKAAVEEEVQEEKKELTEEEKKAKIEERKEKRKAENQQAVLNHFEVQNKRSIYAVSLYEYGTIVQKLMCGYRKVFLLRKSPLKQN